MSGGYFDYDQYRIGFIADSIEHLIRTNDSKELDDFGDPEGRGYTDETILKFKEAAKYLKIAQVYAQRIDWLVSCDDGEDSFLERLKEELAEAKRETG